MSVEKVRIVRESTQQRQWSSSQRNTLLSIQSNIKCVEFYIPKGGLGQIDPALIAYNDEDLYIISALPQPIPGFYRIISNEQAEWDMFYYPMTSIEQAGFDE